MYYAKQISETKSGKQTIAVLTKESDDEIGAFQRNYGSGGVETFAPFCRNGNWFALYSPSYVAISVMEIPSMKYIGGENQKNGFGFCPFEIYIPRYQWLVQKGKSEEEMASQKIPKENWHWVGKDRYCKEYDQENSCFKEDEDQLLDIDMKIERAVFYEDLALVTRIYWACSWEELQVRDISRAHEGVITTLPDWKLFQPNDKLSLKDSIRLHAFDQNTKEEKTELNITMVIEKTVRRRKDGSFKYFE